MSKELSRREHAALYGPTTGDAVRLADTDLFAQIERDLTHRGDEAVFGGGKVIRGGMGHHGRGSRLPDASAADEKRAKFSHDAARNGKACSSIVSWKRCGHAARPNTKRKKRDRDGRLCQAG